MDFGRFIKLLLRRKWLLLGIPLLTVVLAFLFTRNLPDQYASRGQLATGLADQTQVGVSAADALGFQEQRINQAFNNLIQTMLTKRILDQVGYRLILHDLTDTTPSYRAPSKLLQQLNASAVEHAIDVYSKKYAAKEPLYLNDPDQAGLRKVMQSMGYDDESLYQTLLIYRLQNSDFVQVDYTSESPMLSAAIINTTIEEFIIYYTGVVKENQLKAVNFLDSVLRRKQGELSDQVLDLKRYKISNRILNLSEQAKQLYEQSKDIEARRQQTEQLVVANNGAIKALNNRFSPGQRSFAEGAMVDVNVKITDTKRQIQDLNDAYVKSGFDPALLPQINGLQQQLTGQIQQNLDQYITNPLATKDNLISQKVQLEIARDVAQNSIRSLDAEQARISRKFDQLVPHEASIQSLENNIKIASDEYLEILKKYNQTSLDAKLSVRLRQIERAQPGTKLPSKKLLLVALAGILSFVFVLLTLFVLFYIDHRVVNTRQLANETGLPVLGKLSRVPGKTLPLASLWLEAKPPSPALQRLKDEVRALRFEVAEELGSSKVLAVGSSLPGEGRSFFCLNLAHALAATNARVLVIDGDPAASSLGQLAHRDAPTLDYCLRHPGQLAQSGGPVTLLANEGVDKSLFELAPEAQVQQWLRLQQDQFDYIIVKTPSLQQLNQAKEWMSVADKTLLLFEAHRNVDRHTKPHLLYLQQMGDAFAGWVLNKAGERPRRRWGIGKRMDA